MTCIRFVKESDDILSVAKLAQIIWTEHYTPIIGHKQVSYMLDKFQSDSAISDQIQNNIEYYLIDHESRPVGYFSIQAKAASLFLSKLYVLKSLRGKGIGKKAIQYIRRRAEELGLDNIYLTVNKYNSDSIKAYEKMGFVITDAVVQDIGNGYVMDDYVMVLTII